MYGDTDLHTIQTDDKHYDINKPWLWSFGFLSTIWQLTNPHVRHECTISRIDLFSGVAPKQWRLLSFIPSLARDLNKHKWHFSFEWFAHFGNSTLGTWTCAPRNQVHNRCSLKLKEQPATFVIKMIPGNYVKFLMSISDSPLIILFKFRSGRLKNQRWFCR